MLFEALEFRCGSKADGLVRMEGASGHGPFLDHFGRCRRSVSPAEFDHSLGTKSQECYKEIKPRTWLIDLEKP
jgi:hypothetical protein